MNSISIKSLILGILIGLSYGCGTSPEHIPVDGLPDSNKPLQIPDWLKLNVDEALPEKGLNVWIPTNDLASSSLIRVPKYPRKFSTSEIQENPALADFEIIPVNDSSVLKVTGIKNEQVSIQVGLAGRKNFVLTSAEITGLTMVSTKVRYVKYLPVHRARSEYVWSPRLEEIIGEGVSGNMAPNMVGDPLMEMDILKVEAYTAQPIWLTIKIPKDATPGIYPGKITLRTKEQGEKVIPMDLEIADFELPDPVNYKFNLDLWINPTAIAEHYQLEHWSENHWRFIEIYLEDYASYGGKNIATTITHEPWHKPWVGGSTRSQIEYGYRSMVEWTRTKEGSWKFDYSVFDHYVDLASSVGIAGAINAFSITPFHTNQKIHFFDESDQGQKVLELDISDALYEQVWTVFLKDFKRHLNEKGWFERTYLGFDEKPEAVLQTIKAIIKGAAPEFLDRIVIAGHPEATALAQNLSISYMFFPGQDLEQRAVVPVVPTIEDRNRDGKQTTFYLCAEPSHPNTLTYSPAIEAQLIPWLALKYQTDGYLRWAYNNWTSDSFNKPVFLHSQGDDYYVYPGKKGPISSIRWELLKEGIEDYELVVLQRESGNLSPLDLEKSVQLATRSQDGRYKMSSDMLKAKRVLLGNHQKE